MKRFREGVEKDIDENKTIVVKGTKGPNEDKFEKKFKDMDEYKKWKETPEFEDVNVEYVMNENRVETDQMKTLYENINEALSTKSVYSSISDLDVKGVTAIDMGSIFRAQGMENLKVTAIKFNKVVGEEAIYLVGYYDQDGQYHTDNVSVHIDKRGKLRAEIDY